MTKNIRIALALGTLTLSTACDLESASGTGSYNKAGSSEDCSEWFDSYTGGQSNSDSYSDADCDCAPVITDGVTDAVYGDEDDTDAANTSYSPPEGEEDRSDLRTYFNSLKNACMTDNAMQDTGSDDSGFDTGWF